MLSSRNLFQVMQYSSKRYESLRKVFQTFRDNVAEVASDAQCQVKGITVETTQQDENYFDVLFLGQRWRFVLSVTGDGGGVSSGVVTLYRIVTKPESLVLKGCSFSFKGTGDSDIRPPGNDNDGVPMDTTTGALYLVLHCIHHDLFATANP